MSCHFMSCHVCFVMSYRIVSCLAVSYGKSVSVKHMKQRKDVGMHKVFSILNHHYSSPCLDSVCLRKRGWGSNLADDADGGLSVRKTY